MRLSETKNFRVEIKKIEEDGTFEGRLAVYGNIDVGGDIVKRGAFTKTVKESGGEIPLLWQHDSKQPIGLLGLSDSEDALIVKGRILLDVARGMEAYLLLKNKIIKGLSIGFEAIKKSFKDGVRHLEEIKLYEGSIVTFPMNPLAIVTSVKSAPEKKDFASELIAMQLQVLRWQITDALAYALSEALYAQMSREEILTEIANDIEQFRIAYMDFAPAYLDMLAASDSGGMWVMSAKAGRRHSAADRGVLEEMVKQIQALLAEEAAEVQGTSDEAAAEKGTEPEPDRPDTHSMLRQFESEIKGALEWTK